MRYIFKEILYWPRTLFRKIKNVFYWLPVIWNDEHWGDWYIFEILEHKLKAQANYIGKHDFYVGAQRDAEIMNLCVRLIKLVKEEYYQLEYMDYSEDSFDIVESEDYPDMVEIIFVHHSDNFNDYFKKYPLIYKKAMNSEYLGKKPTEDYDIAKVMSHINHNRARKLLFKILEEHIERWWD